MRRPTRRLIGVIADDPALPESHVDELFLRAAGRGKADRRHRAVYPCAETMVAEVKLRALQQQLNPHLFFNTLNAISTLIAERRNDDATMMIARLGDFLRATVRQDLAAQVPLADELALTGQARVSSISFAPQVLPEAGVNKLGPSSAGWKMNRTVPGN